MDVLTLRKEVLEFARRRITEEKLPSWWRDPLLVTARADDRFSILPKIASPRHMLPRDLLPEARTVIVFFLPFTPELANGNIPGNFPSNDWGKSLKRTNNLLGDISVFIRDIFKDEGYASELTPATYNFDCTTLTARWSHKHLAHISGLGRFGVNAQLITPAGCAGRLGSMVTAAPMGDHPLVTQPELCRHKAGKDCGLCIQRCPVGAVTPEGIDRHRCNDRLQVVMKRFAQNPDMKDDIDEVCAKCVAGMPCSLSAP
ncbi:MAG TPA: (Fe-S)-binding protein [Desulfobacteraceae bacterium]|nr:(Fe-S)-binding protein [Desulfobacteraceae bacterium]